MSSRYLKDLEIRRSKIIHVYRNGDPYTRATFVILRLPEQMALERIIKAIEEKVKLPLNRPIRKLFELTGTMVDSHTQIEDGKYYVAASADNFFAIEYGHPANWILVGPVRTNKYANVHYVTRAEEEGKPNNLSVSNSYLSSGKKSQPNMSSKKSPSKKTVQSLKKGNDKKQLKNKNMCASEHIDNIIGDNEIEINTENVQNVDIESKNENSENYFQNENKFEAVQNEIEKPEYQEENKFEEPEKPLYDDKIQDSDEIPSVENHNEINAEENVSDLHDGTMTNISNQVFDNTDLNENENVFPESERFSENLETKDNEDSHVTHHDDVKETGDETERDADENLPQDMSDENEPKDSNFSEEQMADAATKIQATFRGYRVRNELDKTRTSDFPEDSIDENPDLSEATNNADDNI